MRAVHVVAATPLVLLLAWGAWLGVDLWRAREHTSVAWIASRVDAVEGWKEGRHEPVVFQPNVPGAPRVWIVGSSSVSAPSHAQFTEPLLAALAARGQPAVVDNLGWEGMPSWDERARQEDAWKLADTKTLRPDVVVYYGEHNDVTYTFHAALDLPHFDAIVGPAWVLSGEAFRPHDAGGTYWFYGHRRAGPLLTAFQDLGLLSPDPAAFAPLVDYATQGFAENVGAMVAQNVARGVPVLLVTPLGNYEAEPYGPNPSTRDRWAAALAAADHAERLAGLLAARDAEAFTPDMRMKSPLLAVLRAAGPSALEGPAPVSVCDVEAAWAAAALPFGGDNFLDPVHFSEQGYRNLTGFIADCLVAGPLRPLPEPASP